MENVEKRTHSQKYVQSSRAVESKSLPREYWFTRVTTFTATLSIVILGFIVYCSGLSNQFVNDDNGQIVNNPLVHSLANIGMFFNGGTFYSGQLSHPLYGAFYRPLMATVYAALYTLFGPNPTAFHLLQLILQIGCAIMLFLVFRYFFKPGMSLAMSLVFLVHPINSQDVFSIAALQEPLFFLFGITALWTVIRFQNKSLWYLALTVPCLMLSLLSKETGLLFVAVVLLYAFIADRKRLYPLMVLSAICTVLYLLLRIHAVGLLNNPRDAPIDSLSLEGRLINAPTILFFYFKQFLFPLSLAHGYYWAYTTITFKHFVLPLVIDLAGIFGLIYVGNLIFKKSMNRQFVLFLFFCFWLVLGLLLTIQITPLDFTESETWFYFPIVGALGIIAVLLDAFPPRVSKRWAVTVTIIIVGLLGTRTFVRGFNWKDSYTLASADIKVSTEDYGSDSVIANSLNEEGNFRAAQPYAQRAVEIYPTAGDYAVLAVTMTGLHNYSQAKADYLTSLKHNYLSDTLDHFGLLLLVYGDPNSNRQLLLQGLNTYPDDGTLWFYVALIDETNGDNEGARTAIVKAEQLGYTNDQVYENIMANAPFHIQIDPVPGSLK